MEALPPCPVTFASRVVGGRWKARIAWALLRNDRLRYSELRRACPPISDRILSKELKELEGWGLVSRREFATIPPKTEYSLTELGQTLRPVMTLMADWGRATRAALNGDEPQA
jgi:DNA-binding HxlR family transcriptional regulator